MDLSVTHPNGPTLLGFDVLWVATLLSAVAALAVMFAIYTAVSVSDPMAKRVKALNERREQLKAGITASTSKRRAKLVQKNEATDRIRTILQSLKVLQDSQVKVAQQKLLQAGIRKKEWAVAVIFGRLVLPIVIGLPVLYFVYGTDAFIEVVPEIWTGG
jgi:tight adherence protein C